ncbi:uncharacterized protein DEA37_0001520 [Paragonimus westermani]|uniref:Reverse transcriptase domain-containing protein n=1 Tax=Paragonimus westermani TaxID=34504 RepID=A0A5J4P1B6_9TREM|nr:uncharacterized protein DEA37_0001520 [Paragonimus westermani]
MEDQYALVTSSKRSFICMSCLFRDSCTPLNATLDPLLANPNKQKSGACKCGYKASKDVSAQIATVEKALNDTQRTLSDMKSELSSLNEYIALALPGAADARNAVALSTAQIEEIATSLKDRALREKKLVLWGRFPTTRSPREQARAVLNACFPLESTKIVSASRLRSKSIKKTLGLLVTLPAKISTEEKLTERPEDPEAFRSVRNRSKREIRQHTQHIQSKILQYIRRQRKTKPSALSLRLPDGETSPNRQVAEVFRDYCSAVYNVDLSSWHPILPQGHFQHPILTADFSVSEVQDLLLKINHYSAMGPDKIHPRILKEAALCLAVPLFDMFKQTLRTGTLPEARKESNVSPMFKTGDSHSPASYRPISLTSIPCKIMERLLKRTIFKHSFSNNLFSLNYNGFLPDRSCITNMLSFMDSLTEAKDNAPQEASEASGKRAHYAQLRYCFVKMLEATFFGHGDTVVSPTDSWRPSFGEVYTGVRLDH